MAQFSFFPTTDPDFKSALAKHSCRSNVILTPLLERVQFLPFGLCPHLICLTLFLPFTHFLSTCTHTFSFKSKPSLSVGRDNVYIITKGDKEPEVLEGWGWSLWNIDGIELGTCTVMCSANGQLQQEMQNTSKMYSCSHDQASIHISTNLSSHRSSVQLMKFVTGISSIDKPEWKAGLIILPYFTGFLFSITLQVGLGY